MAEEDKEEKTEEKKEEEKPKEEPKKEPGKTETSPLELAKILDESIKASNEQFKSLIDRNEKLLADARVEGRAFAGGDSEKKEETPLEYKDRIMANL